MEARPMGRKGSCGSNKCITLMVRTVCQRNLILRRAMDASSAADEVQPSSLCRLIITIALHSKVRTTLEYFLNALTCLTYYVRIKLSNTTVKVLIFDNTMHIHTFFPKFLAADFQCSSISVTL